jgi:hypothetical protein
MNVCSNSASSTNQITTPHTSARFNVAMAEPSEYETMMMMEDSLKKSIIGT